MAPSGTPASRRHVLLLHRRTVLRAAGAGALLGCSPQEVPGPEGAPSATPVAGDGVGRGLLLAYFSRPGEQYWYGGRRTVEVGFTATLAGMISDRVDCDVFRIRAADPYPWAYEPTVTRNSEEQDRDARPALAQPAPDLSGYDRILLGSPVWNVAAPQIMSTFIESVDLSGTTVLPFVTYAVSGMSDVDADYAEALPDARVTDGLAVQGEVVRRGGPALDRWLAAHL